MFTRLLTAIRASLTRRRAGREADEELQFHIEQETAANVARGMTLDDARRVALRDLGGLTQTREAVREIRAPWWEGLWRDSAYAWRGALRDRVGTVAALLSTTVGVGAATAVAAVVHTVLLRPLPIADEKSLFVAYATSVLGADEAVSHPRFLRWQQAAVFDDVAGSMRVELDLLGAPWAERVDAAGVTEGFFRLLGVTPAIGRGVTSVDSAGPVVPIAISDALWRRRFAADPALVGRRLQTGHFEAVIVGVMPPGLERWRGRADVWAPLERVVGADVLASEGYRLITPFVRLRDPRAVRPAAEVLAALGEPRRSAVEREGVRLVGIRDDVVPESVRRLLVMATGAVVLTWIAICANLALVLVSRGERHQREVAVRLALGASTGRVFRQLFAEGLWLTAMGFACGLVLAGLVVAALPVWSATAVVDVSSVRVTWQAVAMAVCVTVITALVSVALAAGRVTAGAQVRPDRSLLRHRHSGLPALPVVLQISVAVVVVIGATLFLRTLTHLIRADLGFERDGILTASVSLPPAKYDGANGPSRLAAAQRVLLDRLSAIPGVSAVSLGGPIFHPGPAHRVSIAFDDGRRILNGDPDQHAVAPASRFVGPDFMGLHGIPLRAGREFTRDDDPTKPHAVMVNEAMVRLYWPGEDPIGRRVNFGQRRVGVFNEPWATVVGVVADVRHTGIGTAPGPEVYRALLQHSRQQFVVALRTSVPPESVAGALRETIREVEPDAPLFDLRTLDEQVSETMAGIHYISVLLSTLAITAAVVSGGGVFGLVATSVATRRRDHAIRLAVGATSPRLVAAVMSRVLAVLLIGTGVGVVATFLAARTLTLMLVGTTPLDLLTCVVAAVVVISVGTIAAWIPARRIASVDPVSLLKGE